MSDILSLYGQHFDPGDPWNEPSTLFDRRPAPGKVTLTSRLRPLAGRRTTRSRETDNTVAKGQKSTPNAGAKASRPTGSDDTSNDAPPSPLGGLGDEFGGLFEKDARQSAFGAPQASAEGTGHDTAKGPPANGDQMPRDGVQDDVRPEASPTPDRPEFDASRAMQSDANSSPGGAQQGAMTLNAENPGAILNSLTQTPASKLTQSYSQALAASPAALQGVRDSAEKALPELPTPTGLPAKKQATRSRSDDAESLPPSPAQRGTNIPAQQRGERSVGASDRELVAEAPPAPAPRATVLAGRDSQPTENGETSPDPALARSAQSALNQISAPAAAVPSKARTVPTVDISGDADPGQLESELSMSSQETRHAATEAHQASARDFGERDIFPADDSEILCASQELAQLKVNGGTDSGAAPPALPAEALASIDTQATPILAERVGAEEQKYTTGKQQYDTDAQAAHQQAQQDITALEAESTATQTQAQQKAQAEVGAARTDWQAEIVSVQDDFASKAQQAREEHGSRISAKQQEGNQAAAEHIASAERQADAEKAKAESEVRNKKDEAKNESKGFWGWVKSKAKALVDGLKATVNFIYDNLRKAVKLLFEAAKKLALAAIEVARVAIVGLIKAFGAVLKGFVSIALAAFPEIRDRITKRIDHAVDKATEVVNKVADTLKAGVTAIIDFLASTIDKILGLIQDLYNGILTVLGMIISGEFAELMAKLGNLVDAAKTAPGQFETAAYEELLGGNLDEPLSPEELMAAGRQVPGGSDGPGTDGLAAHDDGSMPGPPWSEANVGVDEVASGVTLPPELSEQLLAMTSGGGDVIFGESSDKSREMSAILGLDGQAQQGASQSVAAYDDGLSPRERAAIKWEGLKTGLSQWWSNNWPYVLAGGILGAAGFIVANALTGGAITLALPGILTAIGHIFTGIMVVQLASHLRDFLQKGWNGDIQGGGKSLAKGLAAGAIELISLLTFKVGSVALKGAKTTVKGALKTGQTMAKGAAKLVRRGVNYVIKGGKVLLRGVGRGIAKGIKRLRDLGARLLSKTRFKGFRIRIKGLRFILEGKINPWVKIMDGEIKVSNKRKRGYEFVDDKDFKALRQGGEPTDPAKLKEFDVRPSKEATASGAGEVGDGLTGDHIPSRKALIENYKLKNPGQPVPESLLRDEGITVALKAGDHKAFSRTYKGKNTAAQIAGDAADLAGAFRKDAEAILKGLHGDQRLTMEIVGAYQTAYAKNVAKGVFQASSDIDNLFMEMIALVNK